MIQIDNHTNFSAGKSVVSISSLIKKAKSLEMSALGITDDSNMHGAIEFYKMCKSEKIKPIIGTEIHITDSYKEKSRRYPSILLVAKNIDGYKNICKIISSAYIDGFYYVPRATFEIISKHFDGIICLLGSLNNPIRFYSDLEQNEYGKLIERELNGIFSTDFYQEINPFADKKTLSYNKYIIESFPFSYFINNHVRFLNLEDYSTYDMMFCINRKLKFLDEKRQKANKDLFFRSEEEIRNIEFGLNKDQIISGLKESDLISEKIDLSFDKKIFFPNFKKLSWVDKSKDENRILKDLINEKWKEKIKTLKEDEIEIYKKRIIFEVESVCKLGYASYFIVVADIVKKAKELGILVGPGRGSVAGCLISHLLGITSRIDPLKYGLIFERFLDPTGQRVSPPDIDIDFEYDKKDLIVQYIIDTYGQEYVSSVGNINTLAFKAALKEVAKPLDIPFDRINEYTKKLVPYKTESKEDLLKNRISASEYKRNKEFREVLDNGEKIKGCMKSLGTHAAGIVITPYPITDYSPIQLTRDNSACKFTTQLDKDSLEMLGVQKIDLLALITLSTIANCLNIIEERHGKKIDLETIDIEDKNIYKYVLSGDTLGMFQLEGDGMTELAINMKVNSILDICDLIALYRPVVLKEELEKVYVNNKNSGNISYLHEKLKEITKETYGVIVYQEQIMRASIVLANFSIPESDTLRRAIGKKSTKDIPELKEKFLSGCVKNSIDEEKAKEIFSLFEEASYGFNKSHSLSYAILSCYTMWLKYYYTIEYMTSLLISEAKANKKEKFLKIEKIINQCSKFGIEVLKPEINKSNYNFFIESDNKIRYGLLAVKELGEAFCEEIINTIGTAKISSFDEFLDLAEKNKLLPTYKTKIEILIKIGYFDSLDKNRNKLINNIEKRISASKTLNKIGKNVSLLFDYSDIIGDKFDEIEDFTISRKRLIEKENLGFSFS